jgi:hypothetical protein
VSSVSSDGASSYAGVQGYGYRRGFVLGLTLAEAALLLIFVILMLLVVGFERRDRKIQELSALESVLEDNVPPGSTPSEYLGAKLQQLASLQQIAEASGHEWDEDFLELVKAVASTKDESVLVDAAKALRQKEMQLQKVAEQISRIQGAEGVRELALKMGDQEATIQNQRGQLVDLRGRLARAGVMGVLPSCWTTPEGKIDYLLDVVLDSRGIRVRESFPKSRAAERARLPLQPMSSTRIYSQGEFRIATRALFDWSVANECRFYVTVFDGTRPYEKNLYKQLMETVEGHFYKRQAKNAPPF